MCWTAGEWQAACEAAGGQCEHCRYEFGPFMLVRLEGRILYLCETCGGRLESAGEAFVVEIR